VCVNTYTLEQRATSLPTVSIEDGSIPLGMSRAEVSCTTHMRFARGIRPAPTPGFIARSRIDRSATVREIS
jgi:hypothetical protein